MTTALVTIPGNAQAQVLIKALRRAGCTVTVQGVYEEDGHAEHTIRRGALLKGVPSKINDNGEQNE